MVNEIRDHLTNVIIPFWKNMRDDAFGGYYGYMDYDLNVDKKAVKGCILNSRITWFFANAYKVLGDESLLDEAKHAYTFLKEKCYDCENGGIFWSLNYDGTVEDSTKHTYNQAFAIYALSSYYDVTGDKEALELAKEIFNVIETRCMDEIGYKEAFDISFHEVSNEKLSENGVMAEKTMNTLLHVLEGYTELYRVSKLPEVKTRLLWILDMFKDKVYNPKLERQEVFFDKYMNSILDLHSYGHDIETSWLMDRTLEIVNEPSYTKEILPITRALTKKIYERAFDGHSLLNECEKGVDNVHRIWWGQAECFMGFLNGYQRDHEEKYLDAAKAVWEYIKEYVWDKRPGSEWFWEVDPEGKPYPDRPIVEPWKCPYHNGRMCLEAIIRMKNM